MALRRPSVVAAFATAAALPAPSGCARVRVARRGARMAAAAPPTAGAATLYVKGAPGGEARADCPFSCKASFALRLKHVPFTEMYVDFEKKPDWYLGLNEEGSTPTYVAEDAEVVASSDEIVALADEVGKNTSVRLYREDSPHWKAAGDAIGPVFGAFARMMKNSDPAQEDQLRAALLDALKAVDAHLLACGGPFLLGNDISAMDCNFAPKLQHIFVAGKKFKDFDVPKELAQVYNFYDAVCATKEWQDAQSSDESIVSSFGWGRFFK